MLIYLGAAPGVGKTYAALQEARRQAAQGVEVVVGFVETHGRRATEALLEGLEILPRRRITYRDIEFTEFDAEEALRRRPEMMVVDELAHTNVPGSRHHKRWQDVDRLLEAGIDVVSTVNIQHLESLNEAVTRITGVPHRETVPDEVVRRAERIELADMTPEALRHRVRHGHLYPPERVDAALSHYFRIGNLTALRELALLWLSGDTREATVARSEALESQPRRVLVALSGGPEGDILLRHGHRIAAEESTRLTAVHVAGEDGLFPASHARNLTRQRKLAASLGATYHQIVGDDVAEVLLEYARAVNATRLVLGASRRGRLSRLFSDGVEVTATAHSGSIDVHVVTREQARRTRLTG